MTKIGDADKLSDGIGENLNQLLKIIKDLQQENDSLRVEIQQLKDQFDSGEGNPDFGINSSDSPGQKTKEKDVSIPAPGSDEAPTMTKRQKRKSHPKREENGKTGEVVAETKSESEIEKPAAKKAENAPQPSGELPSLGPNSVDETDLDELLANDALVSTVYNRLRPLKQLKYRLLAMQMGISIDRCKMALEKLEKAGAVTINEKEIVKIVE